MKTNILAWILVLVAVALFAAGAFFGCTNTPTTGPNPAAGLTATMGGTACVVDSAGSYTRPDGTVSASLFMHKDTAAFAVLVVCPKAAGTHTVTPGGTCCVYVNNIHRQTSYTATTGSVTVQSVAPLQLNYTAVVPMDGVSTYVAGTLK